MIPAAQQAGLCSSASALSCVLPCSWRLQWPSVSPERAAPPAQPNSELGCLSYTVSDSGNTLRKASLQSWSWYFTNNEWIMNNTATEIKDQHWGLYQGCVGQKQTNFACRASESGRGQCNPNQAEPGCGGLLPWLSRPGPLDPVYCREIIYLMKRFQETRTAHTVAATWLWKHPLESNHI